jgi:PBP1b-binding outer membrane lipoprotein LpoB
MRAIILVALLLSGCAAQVKPLVGVCDQPDPVLAMMGEKHESLHLLVRSTCLVAGVKIIPNH